MYVMEAWSCVRSCLRDKRIDMELSFSCVEAQGESQVVVDPRESLTIRAIWPLCKGTALPEGTKGTE